MDLPLDADEYIRESIESSLGLPVSIKTLQMKLLVSEDACHRFQGQIFVLQERLAETGKRLDQSRAEANMNAQGLKRCIEEKDVMRTENEELKAQCAKLGKECTLYERDMESFMESYDEMVKENEELQASLKKKSSITSLVANIESLEREKESLRINLQRAEKEVIALYEDNKILGQDNKWFLRQLSREKRNQESENKQSVSGSAKRKRKACMKESSPTGIAIGFVEVTETHLNDIER